MVSYQIRHYLKFVAWNLRFEFWNLKLAAQNLKQTQELTLPAYVFVFRLIVSLQKVNHCKR
jgi:hypothetical protein